MIDHAPNIQAALLQHTSEARLILEGDFILPDGRVIKGGYMVRADGGEVFLTDTEGRGGSRGKDILLSPAAPAESFFTVSGIKIGIDFHWQRAQKQSFRGALLLSGQGQSAFHIINIVPLE